MKKQSAFTIVRSRINTSAAFMNAGSPPVEIQERIGFYYRRRIEELENSLTTLNLEEHAFEIISICSKINYLKKQVYNIPLANPNQPVPVVSVQDFANHL